jgi:hypothetical protein
MRTSKKLERLFNRLGISRSAEGREILKGVIELEDRLGIVEGEGERELQREGAPLRMRARGK